MWRLAEEDPESMPIGFEIAFPSLLETAKGLGIVFPYDHHALQRIYANRQVKLNKYSPPSYLDDILQADGCRLL